MNSVRWSGFAISSPVSRTTVHFYPCDLRAAAIVEVSLTIKLFNTAFGERVVQIEELRCGQPDGVRLEDAFPALKSEPAGLMGLEVELSAHSTRADLSPSEVVVELRTRGASARYRPRRICVVSEGVSLVPSQAARPRIVSLNPYADCSLIAVMPSAEVQGRVTELDPASLMQSTARYDSRWGALSAAEVRLPEEFSSPDVACFAVYRERAERRPISVSVL